MKKLSRKTIETLWSEFDVPINDLEEILESWCGWPVFTDREALWRWFDEQYAQWGGVHALMFPDSPRSASPYGEVTANAVFQVWWDDYAMPVDEKRFDCSRALDGFSLEFLKKLTDFDPDDIFMEAMDIGLIKEHDGPFYLTLDTDELDEYIEKREKEEA